MVKDTQLSLPWKPALPSHLVHLHDQVAELAATVVAPRAEATDREARWPGENLRALGEIGLLGLQVPREMGGLGEGLAALAIVCEQLGYVCPSTALCFGMHCVGTAVLAAKATADQRTRYLEPIAAGAHLTTLAVSEPGSGSHFYLPTTTVEQAGDQLILNGTKSFVTNGTHADSYVVSTVAAEPTAEPGTFNCVILDASAPGLEWGPPWQGFGMRGNDSRNLTLREVRVPVTNLLGEPGDQLWYIFSVVAPYFLTAMAGTYLGIAGAALDLAIDHLKRRRYAHSGAVLADAPVLQHRIAELWVDIAKTRLLIQEAARLGDSGHPSGMVHIMMSKAEVAETAVRVTNEAMTLMGGIAYGENAQLARLLRDARAAHVMAPTTDILKLWTGRAILDQPLF